MWSYKSKYWLFPTWMLPIVGLWGLWELRATCRLAQSLLEPSTCICASFPRDTWMEQTGPTRRIFLVFYPNNQQRWCWGWQDDELGKTEESGDEGCGPKELDAYQLSHGEDPVRGNWISEQIQADVSGWCLGTVYAFLLDHSLQPKTYCSVNLLS